jgi:uncharacterized membrane protein
MVMVSHTPGFFARLLRHRWLEPDATKTVPADMLDRLTRRVAASERLHTGEIRLCIEAGLPWSYLRRNATPRERAVTLFGKLRVWDTEHNNGVLIYLLLAEHAIEIVADRGLARHVPQPQWDALVARLGGALAGGRFEDGLAQAIDETCALLQRHHPAVEGAVRVNELPDEPAVG